MVVKEKYKCGYCGDWFVVAEMNQIPERSGNPDKWQPYNRCVYCAWDSYFKSVAQNFIKIFYGIYANDIPPDLLEIEMIRAKIRAVLSNRIENLKIKTPLL